MSSTSPPDVSTVLERARPTDATPVSLDAASLESTAPAYLRDLKRELHREGLFPARVTVEACFEEDCSLGTQAETERIREYIRGASYLGAGAITVECTEVANPRKVRPALAACSERAERDGLTFDLDAPFDLDD